jgi:hypothetical protein
LNHEIKFFIDTLGMSEKWLSVELVSEEKLGELYLEFTYSEDKNSEHYRWKVFKVFLQFHKKNPKILSDLFKIACEDPDFGLQSAMIFEIISLRDCPIEIIMLAANMGTSSIKKKAKSIIDKYNF